MTFVYPDIKLATIPVFSDSVLNFGFVEITAYAVEAAPVVPVEELNLRAVGAGSSQDEELEMVCDIH